MNRVLLLFVFVGLAIILKSQETRSYSGINNNQDEPFLGAVGSPLKRICGVGYADGIGTPVFRMNPREISNVLFAQENIIEDQLGLSSFAWVFGQFIDHDITLVPNNQADYMPIPLPEGDLLGPIIPFARSDVFPGTGTHPENPRQHYNEISAFIDGSAIYGSSENRANWLRTFTGGKLKMSEGGLLPFNTINGEFNGEFDPSAPNMADDVVFNLPARRKLFVAGDIRANENPYLTAFHTLFAREHNRWCEQLITANPSWSDEQIFQHARRLVSGTIQSIVYNEWLPTMGVDLPQYDGYKKDVNPSISNVFSAAAFRLGHTLINSHILRMDDKGKPIEQGNLTLREAFFQPSLMISGEGIDPLFKGMATQVQQEFDCKVVDDVRNFLFGAPGQGGLDLAAINIFRGRERGLPDYNTIRDKVGLSKIDDFSGITTKTHITEILATIYQDVNDVDPWVGMLAEDHMEGALFGPTVMEIIYRQFLELRDGDRFYYEIDPGLSEEEKLLITNTKMSDVIKRNTNISLMQDDVFRAMPHEEIPHSNVSVAKKHLDMVFYPNPVVNEMHMKMYGFHEGKVTISIYNSLSQKSMEFSRDLIRGENDYIFYFNGSEDKGVYTIIVQMEDEFSYRKMMKL